MATGETLATLRERAAAGGRQDGWVPAEEEARLLGEAGAAGVPEEDAEAVLHAVCREHGWARESELTADLGDLLETAASSEDGLDEELFDLAVDYAASLGMPRKRALGRCVRVVVEGGLPVKTGLLAGDWFEALRRQYAAGD